MFLHDESAVNTEKNDGCVRKEYVRGVVGGGGRLLLLLLLLLLQAKA